MQNSNIILTGKIILLSLLFTGCASNLTPIEVSEQFWTAVRNKDANDIKKHVTSASLESLTQNGPAGNILPLSEVTFGRTVIDGEQAWVDTTARIAGNDPFDMFLKTVLLQENKQWKVDYTTTVASITSNSSIARVLGNLNDLGIQFADKLNQSIAEMQRALPEVQKEIESIEENMQRKLPELQQRLEEFMRQLEEALGNTQPPQTTPRSKEI